MNRNRPGALTMSFLLAMLAAGCGVKPSLAMQQKEVAAILPSPSMPREDAEKIMQLYLRVSTPDCVNVSHWKDAGEHWEAEPVLGPTWGRNPHEPIRVRKATGAITWNFGPSFPSAADLLKASEREVMH